MTATISFTAHEQRCIESQGRDRTAVPREEKNDLSHYSGRIGALIRERRKRKGMSRDDLVERVSLVMREVDPESDGMTYSALRSYECGHRQIPLNMLPYLAACLGLSVSAMLPRD